MTEAQERIAELERQLILDLLKQVASLEKENASLKDKTVELGRKLENWLEIGKLRSVDLDDLIAENAKMKEQLGLPTTEESAYQAGIREGMERAADKIQSEYGPNYVKGDVAAEVIRKEIEK